MRLYDALVMIAVAAGGGVMSCGAIAANPYAMLAGATVAFFGVAGWRFWRAVDGRQRRIGPLVF